MPVLRRFSNFFAIGRACCRLALALAAGRAPTVHAQLTGAKVTQGSASFSQNGSLTAITAANNTVIQYTSFSILSGQTVQFIQPGSTSRVLNWVNGGLPSQILGSLLANGQVYLANPAGIYFGPNAYVNVGALYAAGGTISSADFLSGTNRFSNLSGPVRNDGMIRAQSVSLVGRLVANHGSILAPDGFVTLAAGKDVYLAEPASAIFVAAPADSVTPGTGVENTGLVEAGRGALLAAGDLYSLAISQSGVVRGGKISVVGGAAGSVLVDGTLDASRSAPGESGGMVTVSGGSIELGSRASIDASGPAGGGSIEIGGGLHGTDPALADATRTTVEAGATLAANATDAGNGGTIVVWSNAQTQYQGALSARGGPNGGNGGFAEVSGGVLGFDGAVDLTAALGRIGTLLLDPEDITIVKGGSDPVTSSNSFSTTPSTSTNIAPSALVTALDGADVTLQANDSITVSDKVDASGNASGGNLTLQAGASILINASVTIQGSVTATANDTGAVAADRTPATNGSITMSSGAALTSTTGGDIRLTVDVGPGPSPSGSITLGNIVTNGDLLVANKGATAGSGITALAGTSVQAASAAFEVTNAGNTTGSIGSSGSPIVVSTTNVAASTTGGDVYFQQSGNPLAVGGTALGGATGITSGGGAISVSVDKGLSITDPVSSAGGAITFVSKTLSLTSTVSAGPGGTATLEPSADSVAINLGTPTGAFDLSAAELGAITAGTLAVGRPTGTGAITASDLDLSSAGYSLTLQGAASALTAGSLKLANGATLTLQNGGGAAFSGAVSAGTVSDAGEAFSVSGALSATTLSIGGGSQAVSLLGDGTSVANAVTFPNSGTTTLGGSGTHLTFAGGLTANAGPVSLEGTISSTNAAISLGSVTLLGGVTLSAGSGPLSTADITGGGFALNLDSTGGVSTLGVSGVAALTVAAGAGSVTFGGNVSAVSASVTSGALFANAIDATGGTVTLANSGAGSVSGDLTATGSVSTGALSFGGAVISGTGVTLGGALTLTSPNVTLNAKTGTLSLGTVTAGTSNLALEGDSLGGSLSVSGTGILLIQPGTPSTTIGINGGAGALSVALADFTGFSSYVIGSASGTGAVTANAISLAAPFTVRGGAGSSYSQSGTLSDTGGAISLQTATFSGSSTTLDALNQNITISGPATFSGSNIVNAGTGAVTFGGGFNAGAGSLQIQANGLTLGGAASGTGNLTIFPGTTSTSIGINGGAGTLSLDLTAFSGFNLVTIGGTILTSPITMIAPAGPLAVPLIIATGPAGSFSLTGVLTDSGSISIDTGPATFTNAGLVVTGTGGIVLGGPTTLVGAAETFDAGTGAIDVASTLNAGSSGLTFRSNQLFLAGGGASVTGTGAVTIGPGSAAATMGLGGGAGTLQVSSSDLQALDTTFNSLTFGRTDGTGAISAGALNFSATGYNVGFVGAGSTATLGGITLSTGKTLTLATGGNVSFTAPLIVPTLSVGAGAYSITIPGGSAVQNGATFLNSGGVFLGGSPSDVVDFDGGLLSTAGTTTLDGQIATLNAPIHLGTVTLAGDTTLSTGTANLILGAVTATGANLTLAGSAAETLGAVTGVGALTQSAAASGTTSFAGPVSAGSISLDGTTFSGTSLTTTSGALSIQNGGAASFSGAITSAASFSATGDLNYSGSQITGSGITVAGTLTLTAPTVTLNASSGTLALMAVNAGTTDLTLEGDAIVLGGGVGSVAGSGNVTIQPGVPNATIGFGLASGLLTLSAADFAALGSGFASLTIGRSDAASIVGIGTLSFATPLTILGGPSTTFALAGSLTGTGNASLTIDTGSVSLVNATMATASKPITITGSLQTSGTTLLDAGGGTLSLGAVSPQSGDLIFEADHLVLGGAVTGAGGNLTIEPGSAGTSVGVAGGAGTLQVTSADIADIGPGFASITIGRGDGTGAMNIQGASWAAPVTFATLSGPTSLLGTTDTVSSTTGHGISFTAPAVSLTGAATVDATNGAQSGAIFFAGSIDGAQSLTLNAGASALTIDGGIGQATPLSSLTLTSGGSLNQSAPWAVGALTVTNNGGFVDLLNPNNSFTGIVTVTGTAGAEMEFQSSGPVTLGNASIAGLAILSGGSITQTAASTLDVPTIAIFEVVNPADISLPNGTNVFGGAFSVIGPVLNLGIGNATTNAQIPTLPASLTGLTLNFPNSSLTLPGLSLIGNLNVTTGSGDLAQSGPLVIGGTTTLNAGATHNILFSDPGNSFTGAVTITQAANAALQAQGTLVLGSSTINGNLTLTAPAISLQGATVQAGGSATFNGATSISGDLSAQGINLFGTTSLFGGADQTIDAGAGALDSGPLLKTGGGNLTLSGTGGITVGTVNVDNAILGSLTVTDPITSAQGDLVANGITLQGSAAFDAVGAQTINAGAGILHAEQAVAKTVPTDLILDGSQIVLDGSISNTVGRLVFNGPISIAGNLSAVGLVISTITLDGTGAQTLDAETGALIINGTLTKATGDLTLLGGGGITLQQTLTLPHGNLTVGNDAFLTGDVDVSAGSASFAGNVTLFNPGLQTIDASGGALSVAGFLSKITGDLVLDGAGGVAVGAGANVAGNLTVNGVFTLGGSATAGGNLDFSGISLDGGDQILSAGGTLTSSGDVVKTTGGSLTFSGGQVTVNGKVQSAGSLLFTAPSALSGDVSGQGITFQGDANFNGGSNQVIDSGTGTLTSTGATLAKPNGALTLDGAAGDLGSINVSGLLADNLLTSALNGTYTAASFAFTHTFSIAGDTAFNGPVSLGGGLNTGGHNLSFGGPVTLTQPITIDTGAGALTFSGTLDGGVALGFDIGTGGEVKLLGATGGKAPLASLTTTGAGTLFVGGDVTTNGHSQTYGTPVVLQASATFTELNPGGEIAFQDTVDAAASGAAGLTVSAAGTISFGGVVGGQGVLESLKTEGGASTEVSGGGVFTTGSQTWGGPLQLGGATEFSANTGSLDFQAVDGNSQNLTVSPGTGTATFHGAVTNVGSGAGDALTVVAGGSGQLVFGGALTTNGALSVPEGVATTFDGNVTLGDNGLGTNLLGPVTFSGTAFTSSNALTFGTITLAGGPVSIASTNGGTIQVRGAVNGPETLAVRTSGLANFGAGIGEQAELLGFSTAGAGGTTVGSVHARGDIDLGGAVQQSSGGDASLVSDAGAVTTGGALTETGGALVVQAGGAVTLGGDVTVSSGSLTLSGTSIAAAGNLSANGITANQALSLTGSGAQTVAAGAGNLTLPGASKTTGALTLSGANAAIGGNVTTGGGALAVDVSAVSLGSDVAFKTGGGNLSITGPISGNHALTLDAGSGTAVVGGAIGSSGAPLTSLTASGGSIALSDVYTTGNQTYTYAPAGLLALTGSTYDAASGNIALNSTGSPRTAIPDVATIAKPNAGSITIEAGGTLSMGLFEKFSVLAGNLDLKAGGAVTLSDLSVAGNLVVQGASITLLTRADGTILNSNGIENDLGLDFVASTITFLGPNGGALPIAGNLLSYQINPDVHNYTVRFATATGKATVPLFPGFSFYSLPSTYFDNNQLIATFLFGPLNSYYLDLRPIGYNRANVDSALPPATPPPPQFVTVSSSVPSAVRSDLEKLGIFARPDTELTLPPADQDTTIYDATIKSDDRSPERFEVADARISEPKARAAIKTYHEIFFEKTAEARERNRLDEIQRLLSAAFSDYRKSSGSSDPRGFRNYLEEHGGPALTYLNQLRTLLRQIGQMGLTPNEFSISRTYVLRSIRIPGLPLQALREAVDPETPDTGKRLAFVQ